MKLDKVTRCELIDERGCRRFIDLDCSVELSLQDQDRTLKVFIKKNNKFYCTWCKAWIKNEKDEDHYKRLHNGKRY